MEQARRQHSQRVEEGAGETSVHPRGWDAQEIWGISKAYYGSSNSSRSSALPASIAAPGVNSGSAPPGRRPAFVQCLGIRQLRIGAHKLTFSATARQRSSMEHLFGRVEALAIGEMQVNDIGKLAIFAPNLVTCQPPAPVEPLQL